MLDYIATSAAKKNFAELIQRAAYDRKRFIIQRKGRPLAAIIGLEDLEFLERLEAEHDAKALREALQKSRGLKPFEEFVAELEAEHGVKLNLTSEEESV